MCGDPHRWGFRAGVWVRAGTRPERDDQWYGIALETQGRLQEEIQNQVRGTLGPNFDLVNVRIEKGSLTLLIFIGAVGTFFMGFSRYESFVKSVNLLVEQLKDFMKRFFGRSVGGGAVAPVSVSGSWEPGSSLAAANSVFAESSGPDANRILLGYLIFSHAALLGVLLWLVIRHLK
jgi:hypothetical protein